MRILGRQHNKKRERVKNGNGFKCIICNKKLRKGLFCRKHDEKDFKSVWYGGFRYLDSGTSSIASRPESPRRTL